MRLSCPIENKRKLIVLESVVDRLISYRQIDKRRKEAGGLLIGRHLLVGDHIVVDSITEPTRRDKRRYTFFFRSAHHNKLVYQKWKLSDKTQTLVGLWHTHPEPTPHPSRVDFKDWKNTLRRGEFFGEFLFFLIIGTRNIRVWRGNRSAQFVELATVVIPEVNENV